MGLPALQLAQDSKLGQMTTLRHERNYGDLENPMTTNGQTVQNPECSCPSGAAIAAGFDVPHKTECYIELAKDAEAVQGVPMRDLSQEAVEMAAARAIAKTNAEMSGQPVNPPAPADDLYAPAEPAPQRRRTSCSRCLRRLKRSFAKSA